MWKFFKYLPGHFAIMMLRMYQKTLSFDHGLFSHMFPNGFCRYYPTCSEYTIRALKKHGFLKGGLMGAWRVLRCNPWSKGGYDPVDKKDVDKNY